MKNTVDCERIVIQGDSSALAGISPDTDDPSRVQHLDDSSQSRITRFFETMSFLHGKFVGGSIATRVLEKCQWAPVPDEEPFEERIRRVKSRINPLPEPPAADLAA